MNQPTAANVGAKGKQSGGGRIRAMVPGLAFFAAGIALSALWFIYAPSLRPAAPENSGPPPLSDATKAVLQRLGAPGIVERLRRPVDGDRPACRQDALRLALGDEEPLVREHASWAVREIEKRGAAGRVAI